MNYAQLMSFVAFAEVGSFTHAAKRLHISQPALHVQIKKLADSVGRPLYRRDGKALVLTPEGERLAAYGREVRERGEVVLAEVRGERASGPVVLAAGQGAFLYLLGGAIKKFPKQRWPLRLLSMAGPETTAAVHASRAHLGVIAADEAPSGLVAKRLREVRQRVILPAGHRLARRTAIKPRQLAGEAIVVAPSGSPHRAMIAQTLRAIDWEVAVEAMGWDLMLHFARAGMGIAIVNDFCESPRGMVGIELEGAPSISYWMIHREGPLAPGVEHLRQLVSTI